MRVVKVASCSHDTWWYKNLVGQTVTIVDHELKDDYIATSKYRRHPVTGELNTTGYLLKTDCILESK